jgi:hypothetical protein
LINLFDWLQVSLSLSLSVSLSFSRSSPRLYIILSFVSVSVSVCLPSSIKSKGKKSPYLCSYICFWLILYQSNWKAFNAIVTGAEGEPDTGVQASFSQAVAELQLLGFVRPTRRKTDHMQRQAWGLV